MVDDHRSLLCSKRAKIDRDQRRPRRLHAKRLVQPLVVRPRGQRQDERPVDCEIRASRSSASTSAALTPEQARALQRYHLDFTRAGAGLPQEAKARLAAIGERLATLAAEFGQHVLADEKAWVMLLDANDLDGLPNFLVAGAARLAAERGHPGRYAVTLAPKPPNLG